MKSRISKTKWILLFLPPSLMTIGWSIAVLKGLPTIVSILGLLFVVLAWYGYLTIPIEFKLIENTIEFSAVVRNVSVQISDVREIDARSWNRGLVIFRLPATSLSLFRTMPELNNLIDVVKVSNPSVRIRGEL